MGVDDNGDLGFQQRVGNLLNCPSLGIYMDQQPEKVAETAVNSISMCKSSNGVDSFYGTAWDPLVPLSEFRVSSLAAHHRISIASYSGDVLESQGISNTSPPVQCPSDLSLIELAPKLPCFGSGSFSEMVDSFGLPECNKFVNADAQMSDYPLNKEDSTKNIFKNSMRMVDHGAIFQENLMISDEEVGATSPIVKKRKRGPENHARETHSQFDSIQNVKAGKQKDASHETLDGLKDKDEKKQKNEQNLGTKLCGKVTSKQPKDSSGIGKDPKEDYIHVRAKRGQATNSHSLAERVRREKISERMRFLQDLVPGCNKVIGKAVMLDEIINYVQSLQRQVEFLSMKLATVNPELNIDIERVLPKEILHSRGGGSAVLRFAPEMSLSHQSLIFPPESMPTIQSTHPQLTPIPHEPSVWDDEFHGIIGMDFNSNPTVNNLDLNGHLRAEL